MKDNKNTIEYKNKQIDIINYLKGYSIFTIVLLHLIQDYIKSIPNSIFTMASIGGTGVHVFFFCSGLGLYLSYLKKKTTFYEFMKRRFLKIYIPYIIIVLISFLLPYMYQNSDKIIALASHILLFKMFSPEYVSSFGGQLWFVSTIFQFYLLFIPLCKIKEKVKSPKVFFASLLLISICWWIIVFFLDKSTIRTWNSFCLQYIWEFALGMCIGGHLYNGGKIEIKNTILIILSIVGIGLQAFMALNGSGLRVFNDIPAFIGYISLAILLYRIPIIKIIGNKISSFSYEWYLLHILIMSTFFIIFKPTGIIFELIIGTIAFIVSIGISKSYKKITSEILKNF